MNNDNIEKSQHFFFFEKICFQKGLTLLEFPNITEPRENPFYRKNDLSFL